MRKQWGGEETFVGDWQESLFKAGVQKVIALLEFVDELRKSEWTSQTALLGGAQTFPRSQASVSTSVRPAP